MKNVDLFSSNPLLSPLPPSLVRFPDKASLGHKLCLFHAYIRSQSLAQRKTRNKQTNSSMYILHCCTYEIVLHITFSRCQLAAPFQSLLVFFFLFLCSACVRACVRAFLSFIQYEDDVLEAVFGGAEGLKEEAAQDSFVALVALPGYFVAVALIAKLGPRNIQVVHCRGVCMWRALFWQKYRNMLCRSNIIFVS